MSARARDRLRAVHRSLLLRGGRDGDLARDVEDVIVELEQGARGGAHVLQTPEDAEQLDLELARLVSILPREGRARLIELVLEVDGEGALKRELERRNELACLLASRGVR